MKLASLSSGMLARVIHETQDRGDDVPRDSRTGAKPHFRRAIRGIPQVPAQLVGSVVRVRVKDIIPPFRPASAGSSDQQGASKGNVFAREGECKKVAARAGRAAAFYKLFNQPRELRYAYSSLSDTRMRASCAKHTYAGTFIIPGGAGGLGLHPGRLAAADVTAHKQFVLVHPRVRRSNELAAASEMHPFYQRCARGRARTGRPRYIPPRCSCA